MTGKTFKPKTAVAILNRVPHAHMCHFCTHKDECICDDGRRVDDCSDFIYKERNKDAK